MCGFNMEQKINKRIAEYMGEVVVGQLGIRAGRVGTSIDPTAHYITPFYTTSLDALVPVIDKLGVNVNLSFQPKKGLYRARVWKYGTLTNESIKPDQFGSPAFALASAIYKCLEEK